MASETLGVEQMGELMGEAPNSSELSTYQPKYAAFTGKCSTAGKPGAEEQV
jgi:hypothetical protein